MFTDEELKILKQCVEDERNIYIINGIDYMDRYYKLIFKSIMNKLDKEVNRETWVKLP